MKRKLLIVLVTAFLGIPPASLHGATTLASRLSGRILLQVESAGQAWYVDPLSKTKAYLGKPDDAHGIMREFGLGVSEIDFNSYKGYGPSRLAGRIILRVQAAGEAYYINPQDRKLHYLGRPADAFNIMRNLGLGITNNDLNQIATNTAHAMPGSSSTDTDGDGLSDEDEIRLGTNPQLFDTDMDGYHDKQEVTSGHNPLVGAGFVMYNQSQAEKSSAPTANQNEIILEELTPIPFTDIDLEFQIMLYWGSHQEEDSRLESKVLADGKSYEYLRIRGTTECSPQGYLFNQCVFIATTLAESERNKIIDEVVKYSPGGRCGENKTYTIQRSHIYQVEKQGGFYLVYALGHTGSGSDVDRFLLIIDSSYKVIQPLFDDEIPHDPKPNADGSIEPAAIYC